MPKKSNYNPEIDLLKFLFSLIIVVYHGKYITALGDNAPFPYGYTAVEFFFMVSGFFMAKSSKKCDTSQIGKSTFDFVLKKVKPLYLPFCIAFVGAFVIREVGFFLNDGYTVVEMLKDMTASVGEVFLLMKTGVTFGKTFNGPTWYIGAMLLAMAILLPVLLRYRDWFLNIGSLVIAIVLYGYAYTVKHTLNYLEWSGFTTMAVIRAIAGIALGCFICSLTERLQAREFELKKAGKVLLTLAELAVFGLILTIMWFEGKNNFDFVCIIYMFFLTFIAFSGLTGIKDILPKKLCSVLGDFSFYLYLCHRAVTRTFLLFDTELSYFESLGLYLAATVIAALACKLFTVFCRYVWSKALPTMKNMLIKQ